MKQKPLLFLSDTPLGKTGLGRITGQIADLTHMHLSDIYRVGVAGVGLKTSRHFPYPVYPMDRNWGDFLPDIWDDFIGAGDKDEDAILFSVMNAAYLRCLVFPHELSDCGLKTFLKDTAFKKWIYAPIDAEGPGGRLPRIEASILGKMDRILAYTAWAADKIDGSVFGGMPVVANLPHGTDSNVFYPRSKKESRDLQFAKHILKKNGCLRMDLLLGCVATNTARKDWPLCFEVCQELVARGIDVGLWVHTDVMNGNWDLATLAHEFGMDKRVLFTTANFSDEDMAWGYAACDVTLGIGSGEGFGMPIFESIACGIPCIHGNYAGAAEYLPSEYKVDPIAFRYDGFYCNRRPVFKAADWADRIMAVKGEKAQLQDELKWEHLWPRWQKWLEEGVE